MLVDQSKMPDQPLKIVSIACYLIGSSQIACFYAAYRMSTGFVNIRHLPIIVNYEVLLQYKQNRTRPQDTEIWILMFGVIFEVRVKYTIVFRHYLPTCLYFYSDPN